MNRWYVVTTVVLVIGLVAWFSLQASVEPHAAMAQGTAIEKADPSAAPASDRPPESSGFGPFEIAGLVLLLTVPVVFIVLIARLQHRRWKAYREAARKQKDEAHAARIAREEDAKPRP